MMTEEIARAFTIRRLKDEQRSELVDKESKLTNPAMFFNASQIAKLFDLERPHDLAPVEIDAMYKVWADFYKTVLGPQQAFEETLHPEGCTMFTCKHEWDDRCKKRYEEMWQWDGYSLAHYKPPQIAGRGMEQMIT